MSSLLGVPLDAVFHIVSAFAALLTPLLGTLAAAAAIVGFTITVRLLLLPLSRRATRGMEAQGRLAPQVQALRAKHAGQPEEFQREMAALYESAGVGVAAGCLPALAQWPVLGVVYLLFRSPRIAGTTNTLLVHHLLGAPLGGHWLGAPGPFSAQGAVFAGLFVLLAVLAWLSARLTRRTAPEGPRPALLVRLMPYATVAVAGFVPLAAGLYLATTTAWTLAERTLLTRPRRAPADRTLAQVSRHG